MKKIAIKIENKKQFEAVKKWYISQGYETLRTYDCAFQYITGINGGMYIFNSFSPEYSQCELTSFNTFSQLTGVIAEPEEVVIQCGTMDIKVTKDGIDAPCFRLTATHLEEIYTAFKSLN